MQYYKPQGEFFVGDCMPFFNNGIFHLYYLLDENHHGALGGLGGHQWAHATSQDLIKWDHHPLAIPITNDFEGSICTGTTFYHDNVYYGFYATRMRDRTQHLSLAVSDDGIHFEKTQPNPFASPPAGYNPYHYRDPVVFQDGEKGHFHLLVTAQMDNWPIPGRGGCLAHLVSRDLKNWAFEEPFIIPGFPDVPECPDYFEWNGWYYLVFSNGGMARYRMSRHPFGPWERPEVDMLDSPAARVMKTAAFTGGRRLGVAWIGTRSENKDKGRFQFGGNVIFRELIQRPDGTLASKFPDELLPKGDSIKQLSLSALGPGAKVENHLMFLSAKQGLAASLCAGVQRNLILKLRVTPEPDSAEFGLRFRATNAFDSGYTLHFAPYDGTVKLNDQLITCVAGLHKEINLEIVLAEDIIDVCINHSRMLIDRCPEQAGENIYFYAFNSDVTFEILEIASLH